MTIMMKKMTMIVDDDEGPPELKSLFLLLR